MIVDRIDRGTFSGSGDNVSIVRELHVAHVLLYITSVCTLGMQLGMCTLIFFPYTYVRTIHNFHLRIVDEIVYAVCSFAFPSDDDDRTRDAS